MATPEMDINQLSELQQLAVQQYTSVTNQEATAAIPLLQRSQWNVEVRSPVSVQQRVHANVGPDSNCQILRWRRS
jgi:hypothetical protein